MEKIKFFKYRYTTPFVEILKRHGYKRSDVDWFSLDGKAKYDGNELEIYLIQFNDGQQIEFKVAFFKSAKEYSKVALRFDSKKLIEWHTSANLIYFKRSGTYIRVK